MVYCLNLRSHTGSALLDTRTNQYFVKNLFAHLANLPLRPFCILNIKVAGGHVLPVHHKALNFKVTMYILNSTL